MYYKSSYTSPLGQMTIVNDEHAIKGLWFSDQRYFGGKYDLQAMIEGETPVTKQVKNWLDAYFAGDFCSLTGQRDGRCKVLFDSRLQ